MDKITKTELKEAYDAGFNAGLMDGGKASFDCGRKEGITLGIEMGIQHCAEVMNAELHRFKFPEGNENRSEYKIDSLRPKDNSTFEYTYETYEERMKKKSEEMREMREYDARRRRRTEQYKANKKKFVARTMENTAGK